MPVRLHRRYMQQRDKRRAIRHPTSPSQPNVNPILHTKHHLRMPHRISVPAAGHNVKRLERPPRKKFFNRVQSHTHTIASSALVRKELLPPPPLLQSHHHPHRPRRHPLASRNRRSPPRPQAPITPQPIARHAPLTLYALDCAFRLSIPAPSPPPGSLRAPPPPR
jgi:hypothetical protein